MRKTFFPALVLSLVALILVSAVPCPAAVPSQITVQGRLTTSGGAPAPAGTKTFTFRIFDNSVGGIQVWPIGPGESQSVSTASDGLWTAQVGLLSPLSDAVFAGTERWLEITVNDGVNPPETLSRMKINTNAYSFRIGTVDGAEGGNIKTKVSIGPYHVNSGADVFVAGYNNQATGDNSVIPGGTTNTAGGVASVVCGGDQNRTYGDWSTIGGGALSTIEGGEGCVIGGGIANGVGQFDAATVSGGRLNRAYGTYATVGGGFSNDALADYGTVAGGVENAIGRGGTVGGGVHNRAIGDFAVVAGGGGLAITDSNVARGQYSTVSGGSSNRAMDFGASVSGGSHNLAQGMFAVVSGGTGDSAIGTFSVVAGGYQNAAGGSEAVIGGGSYNHTSGAWSVVPGGRDNAARGDYSLAAGRRARAHEGSFVWADAQDIDFPAPGDPLFMPPLLSNQLLVRATGGALIASGVDGSGFVTNGVSLAPGSGSWSSLSDRNTKTNVAPVDLEELLLKLAQIPVATWNYRSQNPAIRHIGPMAQDFYAAFGVGEDNRHITTIDADGVALAAIQALLARVHELEGRLAELEKARNADK